MVASGPCETWPVIWPCAQRLETASPTVTGLALSVATDLAWAVSGRQYGYCTTTLRPCRRSCLDDEWLRTWDTVVGAGGGGPTPVLHGGEWFNAVCGGCAGSCSCTRLSEVVLPGVVDRVTLVKIDGAAVPTGSYRLDDDRILVRTDGDEWPLCNDLTRDDTAAGTWSVTAVYGRDVPPLGQLAVGEVACEVLRALNGEDCRLPARISSLTRQGVSITLPEVGDGLTGLYWTDQFILAVNPGKVARRARVYNVDRPRMRRAGT